MLGVVPKWMKEVEKTRERSASLKEGSALPDPQTAAARAQRRDRLSSVKTEQSRSPQNGGRSPQGEKKPAGGDSSSDMESESEGGPQAPVLFSDPPLAGSVLVCPL